MTTLSPDEVLDLLRHGVDEHGWTVVTVTHDVRAAMTADRVVFLSDGSVSGEVVVEDTDAAAFVDRFLTP